MPVNFNAKQDLIKIKKDMIPKSDKTLFHIIKKLQAKLMNGYKKQIQLGHIIVCYYKLDMQKVRFSPFTKSHTAHTKNRFLPY